jgi:DNA-binding CsgD family transcriptional regulator
VAFNPAVSTSPPVTPRLHPWLQTLDAFGVPFLCYRHRGELIYSSPATATMGDGTRGALTQQAGRLVAHLADTRPVGGAAGPWVPMHAAPAAGVSATLTLFVCRDAAERHPIAVVFSPAPVDVDRNPKPLPGLSPRENEVAQLLATGVCTKEVAAALRISVHTARHHTENLYRKLGVRSRAEVIRLIR